jgi:large subunit ribosomal protein L28
MSRVCHFTGKKTRAGRSIARRGKAKYLGGVGRKTTGITKRKFKPNIQRVRAVVDGKVCRIKVSAKAIRMGLVVKPPKRTWKPQDAAHPGGQPQAEEPAVGSDAGETPALGD